MRISYEDLRIKLRKDNFEQAFQAIDGNRVDQFKEIYRQHNPVPGYSKCSLFDVDR